MMVLKNFDIKVKWWESGKKRSAKMVMAWWCCSDFNKGDCMCGGE